MDIQRIVSSRKLNILRIILRLAQKIKIFKKKGLQIWIIRTFTFQDWYISFEGTVQSLEMKLFLNEWTDGQIEIQYHTKLHKTKKTFQRLYKTIQYRSIEYWTIRDCTSPYKNTNITQHQIRQNKIKFDHISNIVEVNSKLKVSQYQLIDFFLTAEISMNLPTFIIQYYSIFLYPLLTNWEVACVDKLLLNYW